MDEIEREFLDRRLSAPQVNSILEWFVTKTLDNYLDQNTHSVLKSLKEDSPPIELKELLISKEKTKLNRPDVIKSLEGENV